MARTLVVLAVLADGAGADGRCPYLALRGRFQMCDKLRH